MQQKQSQCHKASRPICPVEFDESHLHNNMVVFVLEMVQGLIQCTNAEIEKRVRKSMYIF